LIDVDGILVIGLRAHTFRTAYVRGGSMFKRLAILWSLIRGDARLL